MRWERQRIGLAWERSKDVVTIVRPLSSRSENQAAAAPLHQRQAAFFFGKSGSENERPPVFTFGPADAAAQP